MDTGFIGTGLMGRPMAQRLLEAGHQVIVYNRTREKAEPLADKGARIADTPQEAIEAGRAVVLMLTDAAAVKDVLLTEPSREGLAGKTVIQMSTIAPCESRAIMNEVLKAGADYFESPVLGSTPQAAAGELILMVGATTEQYDAWLDVLSVFGPDPVHVGQVGEGAAMKLCMNQFIATLVAGFSLSAAFAKSRGLSLDTFMDIIRRSALFAPTLEGKYDRIKRGDYGAEVHFPAKHLLKDVDLFLDTAKDAGVDPSVLKGARAYIEKAIAEGHADHDYSSMFEGVPLKA